MAAGAVTKPEIRAIFVADLHMAAGPLDPFDADRGLVELLDGLVRRAGDGQRPDLVLLGDTFDFALIEIGGRRLDMSPAGALARLERIHSAHPTVFEALARVARSDITIRVVPGNHDFELLHEPVLDALGAMIGARPALDPWAVHVPGVVHAQHGQQHHDINRLAWLLGAASGAAPAAQAPLGTLLGEYLIALAEALRFPVSPAVRTSDLLAHARAHPASAPGAAAPTLRFAAGVLARLARMQLDRMPSARAREAAAARRCAAALGMSPAAAAALAAATPASPAGVARRLVRARRGAEPYMLSAARELLDRLAEHGAGVPCCVLAHTHVVADEPLRAGRRYLNPGTWSRLAPSGAERFRCVEVGTAADVPWARVTPPLPG